MNGYGEAGGRSKLPFRVFQTTLGTSLFLIEKLPAECSCQPHGHFQIH